MTRGARPDIAIRRATVDDAHALAIHRAGMFRDMGAAEPGLVPTLVAVTEPVMREWIGTGIYAAWVAHHAGDPEAIVAGAGVHLRPYLPRPAENRRSVLQGREGIVLNVFVEPPYRRLGIARRLMEAIIGWAPSANVVRLVLHASDEGRPLYESMGFAPTNELRYTGSL